MSPHKKQTYFRVKRATMFVMLKPWCKVQRWHLAAVNPPSVKFIGKWIRGILVFCTNAYYCEILQKELSVCAVSVLFRFQQCNNTTVKQNDTIIWLNSFGYYFISIFGVSTYIFIHMSISTSGGTLILILLFEKHNYMYRQ